MNFNLDGRIARGIGHAIATQPRIDILVNNAGIIHRQELADLTDEDWRHVIDVNLTAYFLPRPGMFQIHRLINAFPGHSRLQMIKIVAVKEPLSRIVG